MSASDSNASASSVANNGNSNFFNLHTDGLGYLNRVREVKPKKGQPFLSVSVAAMHGSSDAPEYTYFDTKVVNGDAKLIVAGLRANVEAKQRVLVGFKIGDLFVDQFVYEKETAHHKKGDVGVMLKGRLILIKWAKVDGVHVDLTQFGVAEREQQAA